MKPDKRTADTNGAEATPAPDPQPASPRPKAARRKAVRLKKRKRAKPAAHPPAPLTGRWKGLYVQRGQPYAFTLSIDTHDDATFAGAIHEPWPDWARLYGVDAQDDLEAAVEGVVDPHGVIRFTKRYTSEPSFSWPVHYVGAARSASFIAGHWILAGGQGAFFMRREPAKEAPKGA